MIVCDWKDGVPLKKWESEENSFDDVVVKVFSSVFVLEWRYLCDPQQEKTPLSDTRNDKCRHRRIGMAFRHFTLPGSSFLFYFFPSVAAVVHLHAPKQTRADWVKAFIWNWNKPDLRRHLLALLFTFFSVQFPNDMCVDVVVCKSQWYRLCDAVRPRVFLSFSFSKHIYALSRFEEAAAKFVVATHADFSGKHFLDQHIFFAFSLLSSPLFISHGFSVRLFLSEASRHRYKWLRFGCGMSSVRG